MITRKVPHVETRQICHCDACLPILEHVPAATPSDDFPRAQRKFYTFVQTSSSAREQESTIC